jgi:Tfp pilus assembly protein PilO
MLDRRSARALESRTNVLTNLALADSGGSGRGGALLQQEIRKLAANNGLTIIGSEVQEPEILEDVDKLRVNVKATGLPENVARFFQSLNAYRPFLFISTFSINPRQRQLNTLRSPGVIYDNALSIQLDVYAYQLGDME